MVPCRVTPQLEGTSDLLRSKLDVELEEAEKLLRDEGAKRSGSTAGDLTDPRKLAEVKKWCDDVEASVMAAEKSLAKAKEDTRLQLNHSGPNTDERVVQRTRMEAKRLFSAMMDGHDRPKQGQINLRLEKEDSTEPQPNVTLTLTLIEGGFN